MFVLQFSLSFYARKPPGEKSLGLRNRLRLMVLEIYEIRRWTGRSAHVKPPQVAPKVYLCLDDQIQLVCIGLEHEMEYFEA